MTILVEKRKGIERRRSNEYDDDNRRVQQDRRNVNTVNGLISIDRLDRFAENLRWEQNKIYDFVIHQEDKKLSVLKISFGVFSLFITGLIAIFSLASKSDGNILLAYPFDVLFVAVLIGMGLINLILIKFVMAYRAGGILALRQSNCIRQALDAVTFSLIENRMPNDKSELEKEKDTNKFYWCLFGQHRKLPIENKDLRRQNRNLFSSADNFAVMVITFLTSIFFLAPVIHIIVTTKESAFIGAASATLFFMFLTTVAYIIYSSKKNVDKVLRTDGA